MAAYVRDTGKGRGAAVNSIAVSFASLPAAGNFIGVGVSHYDGSTGDTAAGSVSDNQGGTSYSRAVQSPEAGNATASIHYRENISSPSGTFTVTINPAGTSGYIVGVGVEYSGVATSSSLDKTATNSGSSSTPTSGTTAALAQADELVIACLQVSSTETNSEIDVPATTGYTNRCIEQDSNSYGAMSTDDKVVAATTAVSASWGNLVGPQPWSACIATFKAAGAGTQTVNPLGALAKGAYGAFTLTPGAVTISPDSLVARIIYGAFAVSTAADQTIEPGSAVAKGVHGSFTLTPGAVTITHGDLVTKVAAGSFVVTPGAVTITLNGQVGRGMHGALSIVLVISPESATARVSLGSITIAPGSVTLNPNSILVRTAFGDFLITRDGDAAPEVAQSRVLVDFSPRIT